MDKRGRLQTILEYTTSEVTDDGMTIALEVKDKRNRYLTDSSFKAICEGGVTRLDAASLVSSQLQRYEGMEYSISGDDLFFPNALEVGETPPDASVEMRVDAGVMAITTTISMIDRKVIALENITTPAGTFECYLVTYSNRVSVSGMAQNLTCKQWISRGVGMVKEESYKANGNLLTQSVLHEIR
ncbi:hypothetical protein [Gilvibacter sp.]|uniref:TapB family protein n=1 Tax=Gilvibacter sp. TaxID=2729997 RepID=UPI0025BD74B7|nr:hypothetical protein [Gilvibacter sp.]NQX77652.1 hypothetical protein [Gilvibacter sp.]